MPQTAETDQRDAARLAVALPAPNVTTFCGTVDRCPLIFFGITIYLDRNRDSERIPDVIARVLGG